ncbi:L-serine ammonia-lyase, iron-sulfur-dependent, subunit alpha [Paenibacillus sp. J2TS4]|uniref:L-serine ammonia-lyase, iron-sulfur-dependent, subunit alpha n=1 Tax=Paenibacillus sp. J2TS4 TaxID=2807194 RepID=UPI001B16CF3F|nr:L-serine ammonia-lyase, iron-sulfur-dependent, subunit alpha [Paenibacillus sp. J2TS4]GIP32726.1 L-serine dehydratase, iron-sulfur-dependent subunit alpha [Paenibacillus sp. J2TS4]
MRFRTLKQLAALCEQEGLSIGKLMVEEQAKESGRTPEQEFSKMKSYYEVMKEAVRKGLTEDTTSRSGLTGRDAQRVMSFMNDHEASAGKEAGLAMAYALAVSEVNASMGRIIATPTAGSCGIIPGVFVSSQERFGWSDDHMVEGLFCAGAIGYIIANNSFVSGAEGGCQAEVGSAIGMAAGAMTELRGGSPSQAVHAVGLALKNTLGLICDPVGGLVEIPCIVRNGFGAVNALAAADMALAGVRSVIPSDEVVSVMYEVGSAMPEKHRETAKGGLAQTPTGKQIMSELNLRRRKKP